MCKKLPVLSRRHPGQLAEVGIKAGVVSVAGISGSVENAGSGLQGLLSGSDSQLDQVFCRLHVIVTLEDQGHLLSSYAQLFQLLVKLLPVTEIVVKDDLACFSQVASLDCLPHFVVIHSSSPRCQTAENFQEALSAI